MKTVKLDAKYGKFQLSPLYKGFGHTIGNSIRRILLITIPGSAITKIKVAGANHLFTTLDGIKEDLVDISLNLKKIKFIYNKNEPTVLKLSKSGKSIVTAADIADTDTCKVSNPEQHIATLTNSKASLDIELTVERGIGFTLAKEQESEIVGEIILDATFTPVLRSNYSVESIRLGKKNDFDKLTMEIWTDGSIDPKEALKRATKDLIVSLSQIVDPKEFEEEEIVTIGSNLNIFNTDVSVEEIELPLRVTNALKKAGFQTVESLIQNGSSEVKKAKNVGEKSIKTINDWLKEKGVDWK
ncbi:DNA-directed RNA polymerase subunit alpha [Patescibacteria group bacterium]|nr:DNA-directed RNA polymerase subunit alpha [Patescibacteria group bacterium]MBU4264523.1 DNA-directed RNA polymerase subunit alpha [Patescibacteria group bacterium]MBU4390454.1 DNA-directed RNA polymerase subunit alpha [Patescibacteria group bacterium]MBU4397370.1 DNA-directed RNA polymerase subunit alpha [Patescibacteria group bacterium]MBU4578782.1 DNA-directed RNA polymerase subunit alpha [Patescibacteria group bacterium]